MFFSLRGSVARRLPGRLGHPVVETPNLDALARDGVLFRNHFGQCTPCGPSRTSLLTGLYLMNHRAGRNGTPLDGRHTNIALEARKAGHEPVLFGYTDSGTDPRGQGSSDPALTGYDRGVMPGFVAPVHMSEEMVPWVADLIAKGHDLPGGRADVFKARELSKSPPIAAIAIFPRAIPPRTATRRSWPDEFLKWLAVRQGAAVVRACRLHAAAPAARGAGALQCDACAGPPFPSRNARRRRRRKARQHPFLEFAMSKLSRPGAYDEHNPLDLLAASDLEIRQMRAAYYRPDRRGGCTCRPHHRLPEGKRPVRPDAHRLHQRSRRDAGRALFLGQGDLLRPVVSPAADHPRSAARSGQRARHRRGAFTRGDRRDADDRRLDGPRGPARLQRALARAVPARQAAGRTGGREVFWEHDFRDVVSQRPETALGLTSDDCCYAVIRDGHYKYVHFARLPPLLFDLRADPHETNNIAGSPDAKDIVLRYAQKMLTWRLVQADRTFTNMYLSKDGLFVRN